MGEELDSKGWFLKSCESLFNKLIKSKLIGILSKRFPKSSKLVIERFSIRKFNGLPLTILIALIILSLLLIFDVTEDTFEKNLLPYDLRIAKYFYNNRSHTLAQLLFYFTKICGIYVISAFGIILLTAFILTKKFNHAKALIISFAGSSLSIYFGKKALSIPRPLQYSYYYEDSYSFPSGHTTMAIALYGLTFYFLIRKLRSYKWGIILLTIALLFIFLIGFSRVYLCVHYFSDVVGGFLLGSLWMLLSISIFEWYRYKNKNHIRVDNLSKYQ